MRRAFSPAATLLTLALQFFASGAWAGPLAAAEAGADVQNADAEPVQLPPPQAPLASHGTAPSAAAQAASGSALAAELMKEAEAGAATAAAEPARTARRDSAPAQRPPTAVKPSTQAEPPSELRQMGKDSWRWLKSQIPWLRDGADEANEDDKPRAAMPGAPGWSEPLLEGGAPGRPVRTSHNPGQPGAAGSDLPPAGSGRDQGDAPLSRLLVGEPNLVRQAIEFAREAFGHPLTWLVISLIAVGGIVVKKIDRRPTK